MMDHCPSLESYTLTSSAGSSTLRHNQYTIENVNLHAVESAWFDIENRPLIQGRTFNMVDESQGRFVCIIDEKTRDKLRLDIDCVGKMILVGSNNFKIIGLMEEKPSMVFDGSSGENFSLSIPFKTGQKLRRGWVNVIAASKSTDMTEEAVAEIKFFLRKTRKIKPGESDTFKVHAIGSEIQKFKDISKVITGVAGGVVGISLLVGGIGIMNIMLVSVSERTREIGLRKAVGARSYAILTQFLIESIVLCFLGGLIGLGLGNLITMLITKLNPLMDKANIPGWAILMSFAFSGFVGIFFGMFPAIKAARLDPIEALRHE